jgi:5-formyltetrahydrofolate cyclo-ligase
MVTGKANLRAQYLKVRKALSSFDAFIRSWIIQDNLIGLDIFCNAKVIGLYYPILNEVQTFRIISYSLRKSKTVCLPTVVGEQLLFYRYESSIGLKTGKYNILEPAHTNLDMNNQLDLIIVPGIVFDIAGNRIGYGKGYYDRLIKSLATNKHLVAGLGYNFQVHPQEIEHFDHDAKLNALITESEVKFFHT